MRFLRESPLLVLFLVAGAGVLLGRVRLRGVSLGVSAVLFAGLAVGALDPALALPELVPLLGLVLFVYTVGSSGGPGFFAALAGRGLRDTALALGAVALGGGLTALAGQVLGLRSTQTAGLFAGALTNTPALAAVLDALRARVPSVGDDLLADPVVAYSVTYPIGVLGVLAAILLLRGLLAPEDSTSPRRLGLENATVRITHPAAIGRPMTALRERHRLHVAFGRLRRGEDVRVLNEEEALCAGDLVTVVGPQPELARAVAALGERADERIDLDRRTVDYRRIFVSEPATTRRPLHELGIALRFEAVITRLRRGDVELLPEGDTELELGDRIRVIAPRERLPEVARFFGDSYRALAEVDVITFSLGIALGLFLGRLPIPLPAGHHFELGLAGGPLVAGLVLGRIGRVGPLTFAPPYSASLTLRQLGLVLFLAGVGTRAGWAFASALRSGAAVPLFVAGGLVTFTVAVVVLLVGRLVLRIPFGVLLGVLAGLQTQPAILAFASEQTGDELPNVGYATVYPLATIAKIVLAQVLLGWR